jgi:myo-inositol-1(or 4)-monophosphatase
MSAVSPNVAVMIKAIEKASRSLVRDFGEVEKLQISMKGPGDFVSKADRRSEEILIESLQQDRPEWGILGEEGGARPGSDKRYRFILDPLDGTTNFLHGLPHWCITVALEKDGEVVAGVTYDPIRQEMFRVEKGSGAFSNRTRLRVSARNKVGNNLLVLDCAPSAEELAALVTKSHGNGNSIRISGSCALDLAYVAAARYDMGCFWTCPKPWDVAAGFLMVKEAGGIVTGLDLKEAGLGENGFLAANPALHKAYAGAFSLPR